MQQKEEVKTNKEVNVPVEAVFPLYLERKAENASSKESRPPKHGCPPTPYGCGCNVCGSLK